MSRARRNVPPELLSKFADAIGQIRYGSVQITIHDSRVVQIEKAERIRVNKDTDLDTGGRHQQAPRADQDAGGGVVVEGEDA